MPVTGVARACCGFGYCVASLLRTQPANAGVDIKEESLTKLLASLLFLSVLFNGLYFLENRSIKNQVRAIQMQNHVNWNIERTEAFYELVLGESACTSYSYNFSGCCDFEYAIVLPKENRAKFTEWMNKEPAPDFPKLLPHSYEGGGARRVEGTDDQEIYYRYSEHESF